MRVLLLSPYPERLAETLAHDTVTVSLGNINTWDIQPSDYDFIVSYGYRHIIREPILSRYKRRIINLHIGFLPWNRGADPNFWSWFDGTYKGITIHHIDSGLDTGEIIVRETLSPPNTMTLREVYDLLHEEIVKLFAKHWPHMRYSSGTFHLAQDIHGWMEQLPRGWDTPCYEVELLGRKWREGK